MHIATMMINLYLINNVSSSLPGDGDCKADNSGTTDEQSAWGRNIITMLLLVTILRWA